MVNRLGRVKPSVSHERNTTMLNFRFVGILGAALVPFTLVGCEQITAQTSAPVEMVDVPDFNGFWGGGPTLYDDPPAGERGPIKDLRGNDVVRASHSFVIFLGDYTDPLLQPWVAEQLKAHVERVLASFQTDDPDPPPETVCRPTGIPHIWQVGTRHMWVQTPDYLAILWERGKMRIIYLNQDHPENLQPSYYGSSVGHWEGDTLVVETIGQNGKTPVDYFRTPSTDQIRVVERIRLVTDDAGRRSIQVHFTVDDPGAFTQPWSGVVTMRPREVVTIYDAPNEPPGPMVEFVCAEDNRLAPTGEERIPIETNYRYPG